MLHFAKLRGSQPHSLRGVDEDHPLAGLVISQWNAAAGFVDDRRRVALGPAAAELVTTQYRGEAVRGVKFNGSTTKISFGSPDIFNFGAGLFSVEALVLIASTVSQNSIFEKDNETTQRQLFFQTNGAGAWRVGWADNAGGFTLFDTTGTVTAGRLYHILWCRTGPTSIAVYVDGASASGSYVLTSATTVGSATSNLLIGQRDNAALPLTSGSIVAMTRVYRGDVSAYAGDLARNPWQLFAPRRILVPVAAGGGTFKAAWAMRNSRTIGAGVI